MTRQAKRSVTIARLKQRLNKTLIGFKNTAAEFIDQVGLKEVDFTGPADKDYANLYVLLKQTYQKGVRDGKKSKRSR